MTAHRDMHRVGDLATGTLFVTRDVLDGEVRNTFYRREDGRACRYDGNVPVARLGLIQANADGEVRYKRALDVPCRDPGEMHGLVPCYLVSDFGDISSVLSMPANGEGRG
ncbi:hypothetical protein [Oricola thermophila]|uniref:Uncharacterized protein n=1 Tax=Oricola thermophila TaxID=2742145 RepID=A0A6N1VE46_9HYPH|nr:hypothetical protein [Oricola thermophila]QKV17875.1 hypothetical protein HTY61_05070 [Oricola thermophila]